MIDFERLPKESIELQAIVQEITQRLTTGNIAWTAPIIERILIGAFRVQAQLLASHALTKLTPLNQAHLNWVRIIDKAARSCNLASLTLIIYFLHKRQMLTSHYIVSAESAIAGELSLSNLFLENSAAFTAAEIACYQVQKANLDEMHTFMQSFRAEQAGIIHPIAIISPSSMNK